MAGTTRCWISSNAIQSASFTSHRYSTPTLPLVWWGAGPQIGTLQSSAAAMLGLPVGIPVISAGHDTQVRPFGAGADQNEPVLSSGTSEILMVRSARLILRC
ncbi:hypothetical protein ACNKHT_18010 [Shigella flexneri]